MKSKQLRFIAAMAVILWACNHSPVSRSMHMLGVNHPSQSKETSNLLSLLQNRQHPQQVVKKPRKKSVATTKQATILQPETQIPVQLSYQDEPPLTLEKLYKQLDAPQQIFTIDANKDNTITCAQGTEIFIPKGSFELKTEENNAMVSIEVKEYYGKAALLMGNLGTVSNDQLIESGGTLYMQATFEGNNLQLQKNKKIDIRFPGKGELAEGMELFTGDKDTHGQINWQSNKNMYTGYKKNSNQSNPYKKTAYPAMHYKVFKWKLDRTYKLPAEAKKFRKTVVFKFEIDPKGNLLSVSTDSVISQPVMDEIMPILKKLTKWKIEGELYSKKKKKDTENITEYLTLQFSGRRVSVKRNREFKKTYYSRRYWSSYIGQPNAPLTNNQNSNQPLSAMDSTMYYAFSTNRMGWINCDRFLGTDAPLVNVKVPGNYNNSAQVDYKLILKEINSIMPAYTGEGSYQFYNIPEGYKATLLSVKINDNKIYVGSKDIVAGNPVGEMSFKMVTVDELKSLIEQINL
jgi:hypothetical protein